MLRGYVPDGLTKGPFTTAQANVLGLSKTALQGDQWRHLFRDVWVHRDVCVGLRDRRPGPRGDLIWVGCRLGQPLRTRAGCLVRELTVEESDLQYVDGALMTTPLRTVFAAYLACHGGRRGVRQVERVIELMEPKSESPMETRLRLLLVLAGLPRPEAQLVVEDAAGRFVARADLGYREQRVLIEYDGAWHWEQRRHDDRRREMMWQLGWTVIVVSSEDYYQNPQTIIEKVRAALFAPRQLGHE